MGWVIIMLNITDCSSSSSRPSPPQINAMPGGYWSLPSTERSRVPDAHNGATASTEDYRYRDARLAMLSGWCVKCFGPGAGRGGKCERWGNDRAAIFFKSPVTDSKGASDGGWVGRGVFGLWRHGGEQITPLTAFWREDFSADKNKKSLSCDPTWSTRNKPAWRVRSTFAGYLGYLANCSKVFVKYLLPFPLKLHFPPISAQASVHNKGCVRSPGCRWCPWMFVGCTLRGLCGRVLSSRLVMLCRGRVRASGNALRRVCYLLCSHQTGDAVGNRSGHFSKVVTFQIKALWVVVGFFPVSWIAIYF